MPSPNACCNPKKKKKHGSVYKNLQLVSENWNPAFKVFFGKYVCASCKREMYRDIKNNPGKTFEDEEPSTSANSNSSTDSCEIDDFSCHDKDFTCTKFDQAVKRVKMIELLKNVSFS